MKKEKEEEEVVETEKKSDSTAQLLSIKTKKLEYMKKK